MAPKVKKKEKQNVDSNKKEIKKTENKKCGSSRCCYIILSLVTVAVAVVAFKIYEDVTTVPELPKVDLEEWWGPVTKSHDTSIRKFRVVFSDAMLEGLRRKNENYRRVVYSRGMKSVNDSWSYGVNSEALAQVFSHWQFKYSYRDRVRYLNQFEHFKTNVQGLDVHFVHVKPKVEKNVKVLPLLLLHGWPGSVRDFYEVIPQLTKVRPGYDFVFEVIVPSLPGFVYSQAPVRPGLNTLKMAIIMRNLMQRLGFNQYYIQGGDFGNLIGSHMATVFPNEVLGFHSSYPINLSKHADLVWILGAVWPSLVAKEHVDKMYPLSDKLGYILEETAYAHLQGTKPDTIGIVLQDSPVGLMGYILDRLLMFTNPNNKNVAEGGLSDFSLTDILDNVLLYWSTNSITTAVRLHKEVFSQYGLEQTLAKIPTPVPFWGLRPKYEISHSPDFVLRWKYPKMVGMTNLNVGGHYIAFEKPKELSNDIFKAVQSFLKYRQRN